jgi:hypothetical protein
MAPLAQRVGQNWFFYHNFKSIQLFFNLFFALDLYNYYACFADFFFQKNQSRRFFLFQQPTMIFSKKLFQQNMCINNKNPTQKTY